MMSLEYDMYHIIIIFIYIYIYHSFKKVSPCHTYHPNDSMDDANSNRIAESTSKDSLQVGYARPQGWKTLEMVGLKSLSW